MKSPRLLQEVKSEESHSLVYFHQAALVESAFPVAAGQPCCRRLLERTPGETHTQKRAERRSAMTLETANGTSRRTQRYRFLRCGDRRAWGKPENDRYTVAWAPVSALELHTEENVFKAAEVEEKSRRE